MLISSAYAAATEAVTTVTTTAAPVAPSAGEAFGQTILFTVVLIALFYFLLIRPQQKRFKEHSNMLSKLTKGDKIVTQGGMVGTIRVVEDGKDQVEIDFGNNVVISIMRNAIMGKYEEKPANNNDKNKK